MERFLQSNEQMEQWNHLIPSHGSHAEQQLSKGIRAFPWGLKVAMLSGGRGGLFIGHFSDFSMTLPAEM